MTIGDPYDKNESLTKEERLKRGGRERGKQIMTGVPKKGQTQGYFTTLTYQNEPYWEAPPPSKTSTGGKGGKDGASVKKSGFGSSDGNRRAEFAHTMPTLRWKEHLTKEYEYNRIHAERTAAIRAKNGDDRFATTDSLDELEAKVNAASASGDPNLFFQSRVPELYDIGRSESGLTPFCNKCSKDTFFCVHRVGNAAVTCRRPTTLKTISQEIGGGDVITVAKPQFGLKGGLKDFKDASHLGPAFD